MGSRGINLAQLVGGAILLALSLGAQGLRFDTVVDSVLRDRLQAIEALDAARLEKLAVLFTEAGCAAERQPVKSAKTPNLVCTLRGTTDDVIVTGAHYDSACGAKPDKNCKSMGGIDNWSGASLLPSLYQALAKQPRRFTYVFVAFTAEERGLIGAKSYVSQWKKADLPRLRAMVNVDSVGLSPPKIWVSRSDKTLVDAAGRLAGALKVPVSGMNVDQVGDTDSHPFKDRKIPVLDVHSVTQETLGILHSERDTLENVSFEHYRDTYRFLAAYLVYLEQVVPPRN